LRILAVSDQVVDCIYSRSIGERFGDVELVVSRGDLPYSYLEFIVSMLNVPCLYVHGNHDRPEYRASGVRLTEPGGWINVDGRVAEEKGLLVAGLEGSLRYKPDAPFQYTEEAMAWKMRSLTPILLMNRFRYGRHLDILIAHSPPFGIHDGEDLPHRGFRAFLTFMERFSPRYLLHGHKHVYGPEPTRTCYLSTEVLNVYPYRVVDV